MIIDFCTDNTWPQVQNGYGVLILKEKTHYIPKRNSPLSWAVSLLFPDIFGPDKPIICCLSVATERCMQYL